MEEKNMIKREGEGWRSKETEERVRKVYTV